MSKEEKFIPFQHRPPNKFLRYEERRFQFSHGSGIERIAHFINKKGKPDSVVVQVIWDEQPFSKEWEEKYGKNKTDDNLRD